MTQAIDAFERIIKCVDRYDVSGMYIDTVRNALMRESVDVDIEALKRQCTDKLVGGTSADYSTHSTSRLLCLKIEGAIEHIAKLGLLRTGWLPIESAPKDGTEILVYCPNQKRMQHVAHWWRSADGLSGRWENSQCGQCKPTHWMPPPAPPQKDTP